MALGDAAAFANYFIANVGETGLRDGVLKFLVPLKGGEIGGRRPPGGVMPEGL